MKNLIKRIVTNKLYIGCLGAVLIQYIFRNNYIKQVLFNTTSISSISQYGLLILTIIGATILAGTILFSGFYGFILVFTKFILSGWRNIFHMLKK
ncbi:hypothetical protein FDF26_13970 [Clostridium botulinum]|uniref:hypothetical protein n=1 Tax=unclassified Clostridium TaxID=2614128 RepID=UPI0013F8074C|nr:MULTISPECIES: hypothetical protein [unclassified Clostridium]NFT08150.1 hypothetical protein [Clostridium botulinum]